MEADALLSATPAVAATTTPAVETSSPLVKSKLPAVAAVNGEVFLSVDPDCGNFFPTGGLTEHMLVNLSTERLIIKVRCSDNVLFRVSPVFMVIEPGQCTNLLVNRLPGPPKSDKIVLHFMKNSDKEANVKEIFKNSDAKPEKLTIPLNCAPPGEKMPVIGDEKLSEKK